MQKLYCYADETGQDTKGAFFLVAVVITPKASVVVIEKQLEEIEQQSGKGILKWHTTSFPRRQAYLERIIALKGLKESVFYGVATATKDYTSLTAQTLIQGIQHKASSPYQVGIFIDGLNDAERSRVRRLLKQAQIKYRQVRGLRDESSALIRLCDALAGLLRDYQENSSYAEPIVNRLRKWQFIKKLAL